AAAHSRARILYRVRRKLHLEALRNKLPPGRGKKWVGLAVPCEPPLVSPRSLSGYPTQPYKTTLLPVFSLAKKSIAVPVGKFCSRSTRSTIRTLFSPSNTI